MATGPGASQRLWMLVGVLLAVDAGLALVFPWDWRHVNIPLTAILTLGVFVGEMFPVTIPYSRKGTVGIGSSIMVAALAIVGPTATAVLYPLGTIRLKDLKRQTTVRAFVYNRLQLLLASLVAGLGYRALGGMVGAENVARNVVALLIAGFLSNAANVIATATYLSIQQGRSLRDIWVFDLKFARMNFFTSNVMGLLMSLAYKGMGLAGIILFYVPLLFAHNSMRLYAELRNLYMGVIKTLISALEAKDEYTAGHSARVGEMCRRVAEAMKLPQETQEILYYVGFLHDIGKLGIPDEILKKPGALTLSEYLVMQQHPTIGSSIVKDLKFLGKAPDWILHHHERYDGTGFPGKLKGEDIPLGARIITVVDSFDAMSSDRPYRKGCTPEEAYAELRRGAGVQFDPRVVEAFLSLKEPASRQEELVPAPAEEEQPAGEQAEQSKA